MILGVSSCKDDEPTMNNSISGDSSYEVNITINGVESKVKGSANNSEAGDLYLNSARGINNYPVGTFAGVKLHLNSINRPKIL